MNDEYISKLRELERLSYDLMGYRLAFESPLVIMNGCNHNILLIASQFANEEIKRVEKLGDSDV